MWCHRRPHADRQDESDVAIGASALVPIGSPVLEHERSGTGYSDSGFAEAPMRGYGFQYTLEKLRESEAARRHARRSPEITLKQLLDTRRAYDSIAADYDGPVGNNVLAQAMRYRLWREVERQVPPGGRLLDLGCGTGLDAAHFADLGSQVVATDWSPQMVLRAGQRMGARGLRARVTVQRLGIQELNQLASEHFAGIYSNLGALNCAPQLELVARNCARLLPPGGALIVSVAGRSSPWEWAHYAASGSLRQARRRAAAYPVPLDFNGHTVWNRYYAPREFAEIFAPYFTLRHYQGMLLLAPPPPLIDLYGRLGRVGRALLRLDQRAGRLPLARDIGDHFLMTLTKRG
jgi:SAM-dependent methyltransferase